jgi:PAS domain S-box-containing protein
MCNCEVVDAWMRGVSLDQQAALFDALPDPAYAVDRALGVVAINRAAERHFGVGRHDVLSRAFREAFPSLAGTFHEELLTRAVATGRATEATADSVYRPGARLKIRVFPVMDGMGVVFQDVTAIERTMADLAVSEALRRASEEAAQAGLAELKAIYDNAPVGLCVVDRDRRFRRVNARLAEINGVPAGAHLGRTVAEVVPGISEQAEPFFERIFATGEPILDVEISGETPAAPGVLRHWRESWHPLRDATGAVVAVNIVAEEVTARKEAAERERLLVRELHHRARNVLMVVSSLVQLTAKGDPARFVPVLQERLKALARAHELTSRDRWERAELGALIRLELGSHMDGDHVHVDGPAVPLSIDVAQAIAMTVHELATNAAKYGALSRPAGRLSVSWRIEGTDVVLDWEERGGPPVAPPERDGFGSLLIRVNVVTRLHGAFEPQWSPEGFSCRIRLPAAELVDGEPRA